MSVNQLINNPSKNWINLPSAKSLLMMALMAVQSCNFQPNENNTENTKVKIEEVDINPLIENNVFLSPQIANELVNEIDSLCVDKKWQEIHLKLQDDSEMTFIVDQIDLKNESNKWWGFHIVMLVWSYKKENISLRKRWITIKVDLDYKVYNSIRKSTLWFKTAFPEETHDSKPHMTY